VGKTVANAIYVILWLVPLKVRDVISLLEKHDWRHIRTNGDHRIFRGPDGRITVVSGKLGDDVRPGTWRAIVKQTGIEEPEK
jgi:predicted RNA binding protein YcfA (HicA-like mRNA interferase family)